MWHLLQITLTAKIYFEVGLIDTVSWHYRFHEQFKAVLSLALYMSNGYGAGYLCQKSHLTLKLPASKWT